MGAAWDDDPPVHLTRRGRWVLGVLVTATLVLAFVIGAATANTCYWGKCGPADPAPTTTGGAP